MSYMNYGGSMLDYARQTCDSVKADVDYGVISSGNKAVQELFPEEDTDFDGEFVPDPEQVAAWANEERPVYNGEWRYVNCGPARVKQLLAVESDPEERKALKVAEDYWSANGGYSAEDLSDWVHPMQETPREAIHTTMRDMHANLDPVRWEPTSMGTLVAKGDGPQTRSGPDDGEMSLCDELAFVLDSNATADDLYFEAGGWVPPCNDTNDIDLCLKYDVDEVLNY